MLKIQIKSEDNLDMLIPDGIYVNGYIIKASMCTTSKDVVQSKKVEVIKTTTTTTPKEEEDGNT
jgi:hypothetical protein